MSYLPFPLPNFFLSCPTSVFFNFSTITLKGGSKYIGGCCGRDRMVVGFTTTYAISAYHH